MVNRAKVFSPLRGQNLYYALGFASFLVLLSLAPTVYHRLSCPFQVQQEEAIIMEFGRVLSAGEPLYRDILQGGPYLHPYPALYPVLLSFFMKFIPGLWLPGRLPAFFSYLACGFLLAGWGWKKWGPGLALALTGLFWLSPTWLSWGTMARMDSLLVLVNFIAFLQVYHSGRKKEEKKEKQNGEGWALAGFLNSLAMMMKSSACTFTLTALVFTLWNRKWKQAFLFLAALIIPYAVVTFYWQWKSEGNYILFLRMQAGDLHLDSLWYFLTTSFARECGWLVLAVSLAFWKTTLPLLLKLQVIFSGLWFLAASCQATSAENHYMEFILFGIFALGEGLTSKGLRLSHGMERTVLALLGLGFVLNATSPLPRVPSAEEMSAKSKMLSFYEKPGEYLALDADLPYMAGKRIWYQYSGAMVFYRQGNWDPAPLIRDIRGKKFVGVELYDIPRQYLLPPPVEDEIMKNYNVSARNYGRLWLVPKGAPK